MKIRRALGRSGESIVEVMVSTVIFLMLMAVLQGAIMFSSSTQEKSRQIRRDTAEICGKLQEVSVAEDTGAETYEFYASSSDGTAIGNRVFSIPARKQKKKVWYTGADGEESQVTFYVFGADGGTSP